MIRTKKMKDGNKIKIITESDGESFEQQIVKVCSDKVWVKSSNGNEYPVSLSDRVRMLEKIENGDVAVIKKFKNVWLVFDVIKQDKEPELTDEEEKELELKQIKELEDINWGEY